MNDRSHEPQASLGRYGLSALLPLLLVLSGAAPPPPPGTIPVAPTAPATIAPTSPVAAPEEVTPDVDRALNLLAMDIDRQLMPNLKPRVRVRPMKVVVLGFANLSGQSTVLGQWVAEELITRMFKTLRYDIPDRHYVRQVVQQYRLAQGGLTRPSNIQQFRRLVGAQVVIFGTVSDIGSAIRINARIYRTDYGNVSGVSATQMPATPGLVNLLRQVDPTLGAGGGTTPRKPTPSPARPTASPGGPDGEQQTYWATTARASSEYDSEGWNAARVTGPPDTSTCGDFSSAWAPKEPDVGTEWLEVGFGSKIAVSAIRIRQTFNPGTVVKVESLTSKEAVLIWQGTDPTAECPGELTIQPVKPITLDRLRITLDTAKVAGFNEIDAVGVTGVKL